MTLLQIRDLLVSYGETEVVHGIDLAFLHDVSALVAPVGQPRAGPVGGEPIDGIVQFAQDQHAPARFHILVPGIERGAGADLFEDVVEAG